MRRNNVQPNTPQKTTWRMRIACSITKATDIQSEYVIRIALPLQQWLHDRVWFLRNAYASCLPIIKYVYIPKSSSFPFVYLKNEEEPMLLMTSNVSAIYPYATSFTFIYKMVIYFISVLSTKFLCCSDRKIHAVKLGIIHKHYKIDSGNDCV